MKYIITSKQYKLLKEEEQEVLHIPSINLFGGWYGLQEFLKRRGNPPFSIGGNLNLEGEPIESLGNLISVGGFLNLDNTPIKSLGNLTSVGGTLFLAQRQIKSLGNLTSIGGNLDLRHTSIKSLGNLTSVGGYLDLYKSSIKSFGNLTSVGEFLDLEYTPFAKKYTEEQIRDMVSVGEEIYL